MSGLDHSDRIYIGDLATRLGRSQHTIRMWTKRPDFPKKLRPREEGGRGKLYWTAGQLEGLQRYAEQRLRLKGSFGRPSTRPRSSA